MKRRIKKENSKVNGSKLKIAIVVSKFNQDITGKMLDGAVKTLRANQVKESNIAAIWVPGSFEIPLACQKLARSKKYDGLIALGCVIKGETDHYYYVAGETARGVMQVMLNNSIPIGFGIITTNNIKQAKARISKGTDAAQAVLEMLNL